MKGARYRADVGFEGQCDGCLEWWPMDLEFWYPRRTLRHCRACERTKTRIRMALMREDPAVRAKNAASTRAYYQYAKSVINAKRNEDRQLRRLSDPEYAERRRAYQREWMRKYRARKAA